MYEKGVVVEVDDGKAKVVFARTSACKNCRACIKAGPEEMMVVVDNTLNAKVGDKVAVAMNSSSFMEATLIMYGTPLFGLLVGVGIPMLFGAPDWVSALAGILCAIASYGIIRALEPKFKRSKRLGHRMDHIVSKEQ
ncbi:MAG: SoxR reducing system RseC family protein [Christensenellales bacterium]|jgi:sigma-E factor negative regulatory protein RseC